MDGPRFLKLRSSFEKSVDAILLDRKIDRSVKEDLLSVFTETSLKYSLPSKLNELDARIAAPASFYDISQEEPIRQILLSYIQQPTEALLSYLEREAERVNALCSRMEKDEAEIDKQIEELSFSLSQWMSWALLHVSEMRRHTK